MRFNVGADVLITSLGKTGRVVEVSRGGRYRVRLGGVLMICREEDLAEATDGRSKKREARSRLPEPSSARMPDVSAHSKAAHAALESIDLHGFTVEEAVNKVEERVDKALRAGLDRLQIIHGRSSGRIKVAVHRLLRDLTAVRHFEVPSDNPGVTNVYFS